MPFSIFVQMDGLPVCLRSDIGENLPAEGAFLKAGRQTSLYSLEDNRFL